MPDVDGLMPDADGLIRDVDGLMPDRSCRAGRVQRVRDGGFHHREALVVEARGMCRTRLTPRVPVVAPSNRGEHCG